MTRRIRARLRGLVDARDGGEAVQRCAALDTRLVAVESAVRHLEAALEGLQDSVHRRSRLDDSRNDELRRRTERGPAAYEVYDGSSEARP